MPFTAWGLLKATRSHQIQSPSVGETLKTGRPNACNGCHLDETLAWTGENLRSWYGIARPRVARVHRKFPASVVAALSGDAGQRALAAWAMGWEPAMQISGSGWRERVLATLLLDPYDAVRFNAARSLRRQPGFEGLDYDFLAPPGGRKRISIKVIEAWKSAGGGSVKLDDEGVARLLRNRDDRVVNLLE